LGLFAESASWCFTLRVISSLYCMYQETMIFISSISIVHRTT
jgi:hypothetical protein